MIATKCLANLCAKVTAEIYRCNGARDAAALASATKNAGPGSRDVRDEVLRFLSMRSLQHAFDEAVDGEALLLTVVLDDAAVDQLPVAILADVF